jgi:hypothetical protein
MGFWCVEGEFWAWLLGKVRMNFGMEDFGVGVWMNRLYTYCAYKRRLLVLTTPDSPPTQTSENADFPQFDKLFCLRNVDGVKRQETSTA